MTFQLGEFHQFSGGGRRFLYTVPSAGIFELDDVSAAEDVASEAFIEVWRQAGRFDR